MNLNLFFVLNSLAGKNALIDAVFIFLAEILVVILLLIGFLIYLRKKNYVGLVFMIMDITFSVSLAFFLGQLFFEPRPANTYQVNQLINIIDPFSFPSKHATIVSAMAANIYLFNRKYGYWFFACAFLVGLARVLVGVHYPLDVLFGWILGIAVSLVLNVSYSLLINFRRTSIVDKH